MSSILGPTLANAFLVNQLNNIGYVLHWNIDHFTIEGTLTVYLFYLIYQKILNVFQSYLTSCQLNITFTMEINVLKRFWKTKIEYKKN